MNFTQASDFQYVTGANIDAQHPYGDLNRIEIDNDIMPVRTGDAKNRLRGMDIAFLQEAVAERRKFIDNTKTDSPVFSRNIALSKVASLYDDILNVIPNRDTPSLTEPKRFITANPISLESGSLYKYDSTDEATNALYSTILKRGDIATKPTDDDIILDGVANAFSFVANSNRYMRVYPRGIFTKMFSLNIEDTGYDWIRRQTSGTWQGALDNEWLYESTSSKLAEGRAKTGWAVDYSSPYYDFNEETTNELAKGYKFIVQSYTRSRIGDTYEPNVSFLYVLDKFDEDASKQCQSLWDMFSAIKSEMNFGVRTRAAYGADVEETINVYRIVPILELSDRTRWDI